MFTYRPFGRRGWLWLVRRPDATAPRGRWSIDRTVGGQTMSRAASSGMPPASECAQVSDRACDRSQFLRFEPLALWMIRPSATANGPRKPSLASSTASLHSDGFRGPSRSKPTGGSSTMPAVPKRRNWLSRSQAWSLTQRIRGRGGIPLDAARRHGLFPDCPRMPTSS